MPMPLPGCVGHLLSECPSTSSLYGHGVSGTYPRSTQAGLILGMRILTFCVQLDSSSVGVERDPETVWPPRGPPLLLYGKNVVFRNNLESCFWHF